MKKLILGTACLLFAGRLFAAVITNITQLDSAAVFHFSIMSDNKGDGTENSNVNKWNSWARSGEFCLAVGDNLQSSGEPFLPFVSKDSFWKTKFMPNIGDGENQHFSGSQSKWGSGWEMFNSFPDFFSRSDVKFRPLTTLSRDRKVDYRYDFQKAGFTVTAFQLHMSDGYDGSMNPAYGGLSHVSYNWLINELLAISAAGKSNKHIIAVLVQTDIKQNWLGGAPSNVRTAIINTVDLSVAASTHRYGWLSRYQGTSYNNGNGPIVYNSGSCGYSPTTQGYMEVHVLDNPPRFIVQYINTEHNSTRLLHVGNQRDWARNTDSGVDVPDMVGTPVIKTVNGSYQAVDWNNLPLSATTSAPPSVSFAVPAGNVTVDAGTNLYVKVNATDSDGITQVRLYKDGVRLARTEGGAPYEWCAPGQTDPELQNLQPGSFTLRAEAVDSVNTTGTTSTITITVQGVANQAPYFTADPFAMQDATAGTAYSQLISAKAVDPEGGTKTFSKTAGPVWLSVTSAGTAQGTPGSVDVGTNSFMVNVTDNAGLSDTATMTIKVNAATTTVPWVTNLTLSAAGTSLTNAGLAVGSVSSNYHSTVAAGKIYSQTPGGNTSVAVGSSVSLAVSLGPQPSGVPSVGSIITLTAVNGKYVSATYSTNNTLIANKTTLSNYERFKVVNATNCVALQCMGNSKFVSINVPNGSKPMLANRPAIGSYEKFRFIESGTQVAIQAVLSTNYVSAVSNGVAPLQAKQTYIGSYEKFTWKVE